MVDFKTIQDLAKKEWNDLKQSKKPSILVGTATCGRSAGSMEILEIFKEELKNRDIECNIIEVGCIGLCYLEPLISIIKQGHPEILYQNVTPELTTKIIEDYLVNNKIILDNVLCTIGETGIDGIPTLNELDVMKPQVKRLLKKCGFIDPTNINHYIANGGYNGLIKCFDMTSEEIINEIKESGLRGRGGGGFPTGRKWEACHKAVGEKKYVVCNADEGDPGAFMDRSLIEGDPHSLLEGMIIAGYTLDAKKGYIYVRAEYPLAVNRLEIAIEQAKEKGFLGKNIFGTDFDFDIEIFQGAGAFVCGESTALVHSIEGKRGMPKAAPRPRTTEIGLYDMPTLLNNVKTYAYVPLIITKGSNWFNSIGTENSKGTAVFALTGKIENCGLIEVPMGITLREIIFNIGGGIPDGKPYKVMQTGGPSGGCLPESLLDVPVDYESLISAGSMMGSGGMVIMDEDTCMVDVARYFLDFTEKESCGQCVPCRLGPKQMLDILVDITEGKGKPRDIQLLIDISESVKSGSLCGLGQSAPNPVLSTIRYFKDEYEAHINEKRCPAKVCKALISYNILPEKCKGCHLCFKSCPVDAITGERKEVHVIDQGKCIKCGMCFERCPSKFSAIECISGQLDKGVDI